MLLYRLSHYPRLLLMFLLLSLILLLLVVTSGHRDLTRDTDGDGLRWAESEGGEREVSPLQITLPGTMSMILTMIMTGYSIFTMMMTTETVTLGWIFIYRLNLIIFRYSGHSWRGLAWRLVTQYDYLIPTYLLFFLLIYYNYYIIYLTLKKTQ